MLKIRLKLEVEHEGAKFFAKPLDGIIPAVLEALKDEQIQQLSDIKEANLDSFIDCQPDNLGAVLTGTNACTDEKLEITLTNLMQSDASSMGFVDHATAASFDYGFIGSSEAGSLAIAYTA